MTDASGNILTDLNCDFRRITRVLAKRTDEKPILILGGTFTTIANRAVSFYSCHNRNIVNERSHVTVRNLTHMVEGKSTAGLILRTIRKK